MAKSCPSCGAPLPDAAVFCPNCASLTRPRRRAGHPRPLRKKALLTLLILAVGAAAWAGLRLTFGHRTYDGCGEVMYGDWQLLLTQSVDRYVPVPHISIAGEPEAQYRIPSRLFVNHTDRGEDATDAFLAEVDTVEAAFFGQEDSPSPMICSQPAYNPGAPECPLISLIDFTGESAPAELVWTFRMKNGDTILLRQTYEVTPIQVYDYYPEEHPMETAEELQALVDRIEEQAEETVVVNLHLPPVTYTGGITLQDRSMNLYGSRDDAGNRTTFTGSVRIIASHGEISYLSDLDFVGSGSGTALSGSSPFRATNCTFTGWETGVFAYGTCWANVIGCTFQHNLIGFRFDSSGDYANHSMFNDNVFRNNHIAVQLDSVPTDTVLNFQGTIFQDNDDALDNRCGQPTDLSQAIFK